MNIKTMKKGIQHQNIGGKKIIIDETISNTLFCEDVMCKAFNGNIACLNFINRREDFNKDFPYKLYYGKIGGLGYVVAEDEFEE